MFHLFFSEIENEYLTLQRNYKYIVLNGDFKGRTANEPDFIFIGENLCNIDLPELFDVNRVNILEELNIPVNRTSQDIVKNQYGNRLLELCKCNDLFIVNGRIGGDKNIGKLTCKNSSIVDYVISSVDFLKCIVDMDVLEFSKLYSDVHSPISLSIKFKPLAEPCEPGVHEDENTVNSTEKPRKWNDSLKLDFLNNLNIKTIHDLETQLDNLDKENITQPEIDSCVNKLGNIFLSTAKETFGTRYTVVRKKKENVCISSKPWFSTDCKIARKQYRKLKRRCKIDPSIETKEDMKKAEKEYKKKIDANIKMHRKEMSRKYKI